MPIGIGDGAQARAAFQRAVDLKPDFALGHNNLGLICLELGELAAAVTALRRASELDPELGCARSGLGLALLREGAVAEAARQFELNLAHTPHSTPDRAFAAIARDELADARAMPQLDYAPLVRVRQVLPPESFESIGASNAALAERVCSHPGLIRDPSAHATRNGLHTGDLLNKSDALTAALTSMITDALATYVATMAREAEHLYFAALPTSVVLSA